MKKMLSQWDFSIGEYLHDRSALIEQACQITRGKYPKDDISRYVDSLFRKKKAESVMWDVIQKPFQDGNRLRFTIDGKEHTGFVEISPRSIKVHLSEPARSASCELMESSPVIYTNEMYDGSPANEYGILRAKTLLLDLYFRK